MIVRGAQELEKLNETQSTMSTSTGGETSRQVDIEYDYKQEQIRTFVEDGKEQNYSHFVDDSKLWKDIIKHSTTDPLKHTVIDIASRTYQIAEITIASGAAAGTIVFQHNPGTIFTDILNVSNKVTGFLCAHANIIYEIRYNVEPQAVGGIGLYQYYPQAKSDIEVANLNGSQVLWSGLSTVVNLLTETTSTFTVKYVSNSMTYSYNASSPESETGFWPTFNIKVWSPYISPTNTDLKLTIYARLDDLSLMIPVIPNISPPSTLGDMGEYYRLIQNQMGHKVNVSEIRSILTNFIDRFGSFDIATSQTGADSELKEETKGWFSETVSNINTTVQGLPSIPVVKQIQEVAAITLPAVANVARYFGFSKPEDHKLGKGVEQLNAINMNNVDGACHAYNLANSAHQRRPVASLAKEKFVNLSIADFASRPAYIDRFTISRTTPPNSVLWDYDVSPFRGVRGTFPTINPTPLGFSSLFFKYWRGDIIFRFRFFANSFVNFNVQFATAYGNNTGFVTSATDLSNVYNLIVDGKSITTFDYRVDFKSQNPWKHTMSHVNAYTDPANSSETVGSIVVKLQNALTSSSSTVESIDVTVEMFGAENLEYNVARHVPFIFTPPAPTLNRAIAQSSADATAKASDERDVNATIQLENANSQADAFTFGQSLKSFKQLLNIEQFQAALLMTNPADVFGNVRIIYPYHLCLTPNDQPTASVTNIVTYLKLISQPFAFFSGEVLMSINDNLRQPITGGLSIAKFDVEFRTPETANARAVVLNATSNDNATLSWLDNLDSNILIQDTLQNRRVYKAPNYFARTVCVRPNSQTEINTTFDRQWMPPGAFAYGRMPSSDEYSYTSYLYARAADNFDLHIFNGLTTLYYDVDSTSHSSVPVLL